MTDLLVRFPKGVICRVNAIQCRLHSGKWLKMRRFGHDAQ
jgi:hypothetical protein